MDLLIGEKIKQFRKDKEMTQDALAQALDISPQAISKWECGDGYPDITLLPTIANFFEVTVDELIGNDDISAKADVQKNYFNIVNTLSLDEQLELSFKYYKKYPRNWHIATSLMHRITRYRGKNEDEYRKQLVNIGERILKDCTDSTVRRSAVTAMCMVCDEKEIGALLNRDTTFWYDGRREVYEKRYKLFGEEDKYWMIRNAGNFVQTSAMIGRLREHKSYIGKPEDSVAWNTMYLNILTGITQNSIPDGWIPEYTMQYIRLSAAYFGLGDRESGYSHLEKALELCKRWQEFPENALLDLGNPLFFGETKLIKNDWHIQLPNEEKLPLLRGFKNSIPNLVSIMEAESGWEWFDNVRNEERWTTILSSAKSLADM
ncbi:MAG: helix-turn-helix transcriptional regulator [Clostridia bacterium]|nr:helix-turn-helix transcriptional regulator [Clostridia bacterium]